LGYDFLVAMKTIENVPDRFAGESWQRRGFRTMTDAGRIKPKLK
jgi:hypothetical protein